MDNFLILVFADELWLILNKEFKARAHEQKTLCRPTSEAPLLLGLRIYVAYTPNAHVSAYISNTYTYTYIGTYVLYIYITLHAACPWRPQTCMHIIV